MAAKRREHNEGPSDEPTRARKAKGRRVTRETVATVAEALARRDEIVGSALDLLEGVGVLDASTRAQVWMVYQRGDARTRQAIQELVARVLRVPTEALGDVEPGDIDVKRLSTEHLEALEDLGVPRVDVGAVGQRIRSMDVEGWIRQGEDANAVLRFVGEAPVKVHRLQQGLLAGGLIILILVAAALAFPQYARVIAFYGFLTLLALLGGLMMKWAWDLRRAARAMGVDLAAYARLPAEERRVLVLRKAFLAVVDTAKLGDIVERGLRATVPDALQERPGETRPDPERPVAKRPAARTGADASPRKEPAKGSRTEGASSGKAAKKRPSTRPATKKATKKSATKRRSSGDKGARQEATKRSKGRGSTDS